ncbi:MAG: hypothetical protein RL375_3700, partial [Pseudomonadota bacterium]
SIQRVTAAAQAGEKGTAAYFEALAKQRGVSGDVLRPYLDQLRQVEQAQAKAQGTLNGMTISAGQMKAALRGVPAQFTDIVTSLASGQAPLTVFLQQGGQLKDVFGGAGNAARALGGYIVGLVNPFTVAAAAAAALAFAYKTGSAEADAYRSALVLTGNAVGETTASLQASAKAVGDVVGGQAAAAAALAQYVGAGQRAGISLDLITEAAIRLERVGGPAVDKTIAAFAKLAKDPLKASVELNDSTNFLTESVYRQIKALEEQGRKTEAAAVAQRAFAEAGISRGRELEASLGSIERGWLGITDAITKAKNALLSVGRQDSAATQLANAQLQLEQLQQARQVGRNAGRRQSTFDEEEKQVKSRIEQLRLLVYQEGEVAAAQASRAEVVKKVIETDKAAAIGTKRNADGLDLGRDAAKGWADAIEDAQKIQREAEGSTVSLTKAQARLIEYLVSPFYLQHSDAWRQIVVGYFVAANNAEQLAKAERDLAKATEDVARATRDNASALAQQLQAGEASLQSLRDQLTEATLGKQVVQQQALARLELAAAMNEQAAVQSMLDGLSAAESSAFAERARQIREEIELRRRLMGFENARETADLYVQDVARSAGWDGLGDQVRSTLTDAFRRSFESGARDGKDFARVLGNELAARMSAGLSTALADGVIRLAVGNAGGTVHGLNSLGALSNLSSAGGLYGQVLNSSLVSGAAASSYAYGAAIGTTNVGAGSQAAMLAAQTGEFGLAGTAATSQAAAGAGAGASSWASWASTWGAAIVAGIYRANQDYSNGFRRDQARDVGRETGGLSGSFEFAQASILSRLGVSDRWADLLSGATAVAALIGRSAPRVESQGITGTITGGDFTGQAFANVVEKGGLFRSDRRSEVLGDLSTATAGFLDNASRNVLEQARAYADALGLPVEALASVQQQIRIDVTGKADEDLKALTDVLSGYGDALVAGYSDAIAPLAGLNESTAATLQRVGMAIGGVNDVLQDLGLAALQASVDGGRAAVSLQDLFGGIAGLQQAAGSYLENYYTESERTALTTARLTDALADFGLTLPTSRDGLRDLIEAQDRTTQSGREAFAALLGVSEAFAAITPSAEDLAASAEEAAAKLEEAARVAAKAQADLARSVSEGFAAVLGDFVGGDELARFRAGRIQQTLGGAGINVSVDGILASTEQDIIDLWRVVGLEGRAAILEAYDAWKELRQGVADGVQAQLDEITRVFGDLSVINEPVQTLSQSYVENR